ncbi:MAG: type IV toxin-antitoxin system AbiEi family antitoxin domain-containing protein [Solirubrobacteraceae bacterium]
MGERSKTPVTGSPQQRALTIAAVQRGRASRRQLLDAGIASATIDRWVKAGLLRREHPGVFAIGPEVSIPLDAETAALLWARPGALLSHHTAALLWPLRMPRPQSADARIHVTVIGGSPGRREGIVAHRSRLLRAPDIRTHEGLRITSVARTLLDLAPLLAPRELARALDQALVGRLVNLPQIGEVLDRAGRHRGRYPLQGLLDSHTTTTFTRSEAEELFLDLVRRATLPQPLVNSRVHGYEVDFLWPEQGVAVEIDGFAFHGTRDAFERDRRKDARLRAAGVLVIRITWRQLTDEPLAVVADLARALATASRL